MKEASGELSMTAIAVVAIAAIGALFTTVIYPSIKNSLKHNQECSAAYGCHNCSEGKCSCYNSETGDEIQCPDLDTSNNG